VPLTVSRQLVGDPRLGASGYRYCGNILAPPSDPQFERGEVLARAAHVVADVAAAELSLVGVNGVDFVARSGVPYPVEINPRWSASMELVERVCDVSVFAAHAAACARGELSSLNDLRPHFPAVGKAIVFARHHVIIGNTDDWLNDPDIRDVPHAGETIAAGSPVCTVLAEARDGASCEADLVTRAQSIYGTLARWRTSPVPPFTIPDSRFTIDT
jgi:predicted ATP-grasp superfamily ATP-dependent carboligase